MIETESEKIVPVKGKPKSGRVWKTSKSRFSSMRQVKAFKTTWERKLELRRERQAITAHSREIDEEKLRAKDLYKQRRKEKMDRKRENELKSEVVQVIKDTKKIKRMSKKQLRRIAKRDTNPKKV